MYCSEGEIKTLKKLSTLERCMILDKWAKDNNWQHLRNANEIAVKVKLKQVIPKKWCPMYNKLWNGEEEGLGIKE